MPDAAIQIQDVWFRYQDTLRDEGPEGLREAAGEEPGAEGPFALKGVSLTIPKGQFLCVIGHSGCGKSTLLRLLLGLEKPARGTIDINGAPVTGPGMDRSIVFQDYSLFPWMSALENVRFGIEQASKVLGRGLSKAQATAQAREFLAIVDMAEAADKYPYQLSGGMQQRVAIARTLAMDTDIVLFDEPFGALDLRTRRTLQELVEFLWSSGERRKTVVFVTHDISEAILLSDRVVFMDDGRVVAQEEVGLPRPRKADELRASDEAHRLTNALTGLFYKDADEMPDFNELFAKHGV